MMSGDGEAMPLYVAGVDDLQVWRDEPKIRVESMAGQPLVIHNGETVWRFAHQEDLPTAAQREKVSYVGPGRELLVTQPASRWIGNDFTTPDKPIEEIEYLGRACWAVELRPPKHKPHAMQLVIDQHTGTILQQRNDGFDIAIRFIAFTAGIPIDPAVFEWTGPVRPPRYSLAPDDFRSSFIPSLGERKDIHRQWFSQHVTERPLTIAITAELTIENLRYHDDEGAFEADIGSMVITGRLARRRRSTATWDLLWDLPTLQTWTTTEHDWAIAMHTGKLDDNALNALQHILHPDAPVVGRPETE
ncbi:hypothetical protein [Williamsia sp.]|uniref:hypothetical protein n=1 Tax=Williamsia sp. TaxID=1872085 RepID=UPI002F9585B1